MTDTPSPKVRHRVGIMQGRLSPMAADRIQTFPAGTWREEFALAAECGCELLEWVLDAPDWRENPILTDAGRQEIARLQEKYGVAVPAVCCDYFMNRPLTSPDAVVRDEARGVLVDVIRHGPSVGVHLVELPLIGAGSLAGEAAAAVAIELFKDLTPLLESCGACLLLELDLGPRDVAALFRRIDSHWIGLNYDTGNSAYWEFDPVEEFASYGPLIRNVHIKDVTRTDYTVPLGEGQVDFDLSFSLLRQVGYSGDFILQTARGGDDLGLAKRFAAFTRRYVDRYFA